MSGPVLAIITKLPAAPKMDSGRPNSTSVGTGFADVLQDCAADSASDSERLDALPVEAPADDTIVADTEDTAAAETPAEIAPTFIPIFITAPVTVAIPVQFALDGRIVTPPTQNIDLAVPPPTIAMSPTGDGVSRQTPAVPTLPEAQFASPETAFPQLMPIGSEQDGTAATGTFDTARPLANDSTRVGFGAFSVSAEKIAHTDRPTPVGMREATSAFWDEPAVGEHSEVDAHNWRQDSGELGDAESSPNTQTGEKFALGTRASERSPVENRNPPEFQSEVTPVLMREPQSGVSTAPLTDSRASMASIPHTIVRMASDAEQKTQTLKIRLDPPRLGEISVDLKLGENGLSVRIVSQTPEARDLLQQDLPRLQEVLKASGLNLQLFSATYDLPGERSERQQPAAVEPPARPATSSLGVVETPVTSLRRHYETSLRINAHA